MMKSQPPSGLGQSDTDTRGRWERLAYQEPRKADRAKAQRTVETILIRAVGKGGGDWINEALRLR